MTTLEQVDIDGEEIINSLELISESKDHLLTFINACGYNKEHREYKKVKFLIKRRSDLVEWVKIFVDTFEANVERVIDTSDLFKTNKIKNLNIGLNEFIVLTLDVGLTLDKLKNGLEDLFQVECSDDDVKKINEKLHSNELGLDMIYKKFKEDLFYNTAGKFARANWKVIMLA